MRKQKKSMVGKLAKSGGTRLWQLLLFQLFDSWCELRSTDCSFIFIRCHSWFLFYTVLLDFRFWLCERACGHRRPTLRQRTSVRTCCMRQNAISATFGVILTHTSNVWIALTYVATKCWSYSVQSRKTVWHTYSRLCIDCSLSDSRVKRAQIGHHWTALTVRWLKSHAWIVGHRSAATTKDFNLHNWLRN